MCVCVCLSVWDKEGRAPSLCVRGRVIEKKGGLRVGSGAGGNLFSLCRIIRGHLKQISHNSFFTLCGILVVSVLARLIVTCVNVVVRNLLEMSFFTLCGILVVSVLARLIVTCFNVVVRNLLERTS